jgi:hypothetical protein
MRNNTKHIPATSDKVKTMLFSSNNAEAPKKSAQMEDVGKNMSKELRGWDSKGVRQVNLSEPEQKDSSGDIFLHFLQRKLPDTDKFIIQEDTKDYSKLQSENFNLRNENEYLRRCLKEAKGEVEKAQERIEELENEVSDLKVQLSKMDSGIPVESVEEVKEEAPNEAIKEYAKKLNYDTSNAEELKSLELALKLEAEDRMMMERQLYMQQNEALRAMNNEGVDPESMSYEQLLELEEKIGSISKGLTTEEIQVYSNIIHRTFLLNLSLEHYQQIIQCINKVNVRCSVCQCEFDDNEPMKELRCKHQYHSVCIDSWLTKNNACPICKESVKEIQ